MSDDISSTLDQALNLIYTTTIAGILYTFSLVLYCLCVRLSYSQLRGLDGKGLSLWAVTLASIMIICATMNVALNNEYARMIYIDYNTLPGGPLGLAAQKHASTVQQVNNIVTLIVDILALGVLLWRVWVVYSGTRFAIPAIILATIFYLAYVVSKTLHLALGWAPLTASLPNVTRTLDIVNVMAEGFTAASKIIMTFMIIMWLMLIRRKHIKLMGKTDIAAQYLDIATMLIESYALSTAWNFGYLIGYILKDPSAHNFFTSGAVQVEALSYFLVSYRVFSGRAWDNQTQNQLSTLQWDRGGIQPADDDLTMGAVNIRASYIEANPPAYSSRAVYS